ncbi:putative glutamine amidotransferase-like protein isoform B [Neolecta irregularis DAH-3]|uniref:Putative glutamine amidotransferase-like protein isoform A n=1 Tax=Neolecta irregularis (strain DAH-3) TaxID=1198029 RepID=A0A1U7LLZ2_NEOID|nr:putative glutamine amidotransferase-like protein isoform A [Neolecta irregularis DAH-3]OLL23668.1 putative glutamine amidotransferase-like protein isoform B [Neolecta irregularis DAH-3]|eukprot:OLL23667.1 putative glutamine amidotransferase-like protein isoform A [Neolecta irregularis DAH-3]
MVVIAILEADKPLPSVAAVHGSYGDIFQTMFRNALTSRQFADMQFRCFDVIDKMEFPASMDGIDAILVTGSRFSAYENYPWLLKMIEFIQKVYKEYIHVKLIGICFGHQAIARALGGTVGVNAAGWEIGVATINVEPGYESILCDTSRKTIALQQMHRDVVIKPPADAIIIARNEKGIHGLLVPDRVLSLQGHPEFTKEIEIEIIDSREKSGVFSSVAASNGRMRAALDYDRYDFARAAINFIK